MSVTQQASGRLLRHLPLRWLSVITVFAAAAVLFFNILHPSDTDSAFWVGIVLLVGYVGLLGDELIRVFTRRTDLGGVVMFGWVHTCVLGAMYAPWHHVLATRAFASVFTVDVIREVMTVWLLVCLAATLLLHVHWFLRGRWNTVPATMLVAALSTTWLLLVIGVLLGLILPALQLTVDLASTQTAAGESTALTWWAFAGYVLLVMVLATYQALRRARAAAADATIETEEPAWQRVYKSPPLWIGVLLLPLVSLTLFVVQPGWPGLTRPTSDAANYTVSALLLLPLLMVLLWIVGEVLVLLASPLIDRRSHSAPGKQSVTADNWRGQLGIRPLSSAAGARTLLDWYVLLLIASGLITIATAGISANRWRPFFPQLEVLGVGIGDVMIAINRVGVAVFGVSVVLAFGLIVHLFLKRYFTTVVSFRLVVKRALSYIAMVTVALGVFVLIVVTAVMGGFKQELRKRVRGSLSHVFMYLPIPEASSLLQERGFRTSEIAELADLGDHFNLMARAMGERPHVRVTHEWLDAEAGRRGLSPWDRDMSFETKAVTILATRLPALIDLDMRYDRAVIIALREQLALPVPDDDKLGLDAVALQAKALLLGCPDYAWATTPDSFVAALRLRDTLDQIAIRRDKVALLNDPQYRAGMREAIQWALADTNDIVADKAGEVLHLGDGRDRPLAKWQHVMPGDTIAKIRLADGTEHEVKATRHMMFHEPLVTPNQQVEVGTPLIRVRPYGRLRQPYERSILEDALAALNHIDPAATDVIAGASGRVRTMALIVRRNDKDLDYCQLVGVDPVHDLAISDIGIHLEQALYKEMDQALMEAMHRFYRLALEYFPAPGVQEQVRYNTDWHKIDPGDLSDTGRALLLQLQTTESLLSKVPPRDPGPDMPLRETQLLEELRERLLAVLDGRIEEIKVGLTELVDGVGSVEQASQYLPERFLGIERATSVMTRGRSSVVWIGRTRNQVLDIFLPDLDDPAQAQAVQLITGIPEPEWQLLMDYNSCRIFRSQVIAGIRPLKLFTRGFMFETGGPFDRSRLEEQNPPGILMRFMPDAWPDAIPVLPDSGSTPIRTELTALVEDALKMLGTNSDELGYTEKLDKLRELRTAIIERLLAWRDEWATIADGLADGRVHPRALWSELKLADESYRFSERDIEELNLCVNQVLVEWATGPSRRIPDYTFLGGVDEYHAIDRLLAFGLPKVRAHLLRQVRGVGPFIGVSFERSPDGIVVSHIDPAAGGDAAKQLQVGDRLEGLDDFPLPDFGAMVEACKLTPVGATVNLSIRRAGNGVTLSVPMEVEFRPGVQQVIPFDRFGDARRRAGGGDDGGQQTQGSGSGTINGGSNGMIERGGPQDFPPAIIGDRLAEVYGSYGEPLRPSWRNRLNLATAVPSDELDDGGNDEFEAREQGYHIAGTFHSRLFDDDRRRVYIPLVDALRFIDGSKTSALLGVKLGGTRYEYTKLYKALIACCAAASPEGDLARLELYIYANSPEPVKSWEEERANLLKAVDREELILTIVLSMIILYAGIMIIIIIYLMVKEKTKDIGILKALGGSPDGISSIFLFNGLFIGVFGALLGLLFGLTVVNQSNWIEDQVERIWGFRIFPADVYYLTYIPMKTTPETWLFICVPTILLAFLFALYPANKASRLDPVQSLQYE